jgi:hypothetical protein
MGARINNFPTYVVYDRSFNFTKTITYDNVTHDPSNYVTAESGVWNSLYDSNTTTYYQIQMTSANFNQSATITLVIDYLQTYWNTQLSWKYGGTHTSPGAGDKIAILYSSTDGVTWVQQDSVTIIRGGVEYTTTKAVPLLNFRYIKVVCSAGENAGSVTNLRLFEMRIMGSG